MTYDIDTSTYSTPSLLKASPKGEGVHPSQRETLSTSPDSSREVTKRPKLPWRSSSRKGLRM